MNEPTITRRSALRTGGLAAIMAGLLGTTTARASAAEPINPAEELIAVLKRAESLALNELRFDEEARSAGWGLALRLADLMTYVDPQNPPRLH
jgi:hypothetical protein